MCEKAITVCRLSIIVDADGALATPVDSGDSFSRHPVILFRHGKSAEHLIRDSRRGKEAAFPRLLDDPHLPLFRFAWRLTGSLADAEDIVQECFLALLRPNCGFDPARTTIRTYLLGAVRNQWLKRLRRREQGPPPEPADRRTPETEALRGEMAEAVAYAPRTERII